MPSLATFMLLAWDLFKWLLLCLIFDFSFCPDKCAMGFPDYSGLFFDLIPFLYLLSSLGVSCLGRDMRLVPHQRNLWGWLLPRGIGGFFMP